MLVNSCQFLSILINSCEFLWILVNSFLRVRGLKISWRIQYFNSRPYVYWHKGLNLFIQKPNETNWISKLSISDYQTLFLHNLKVYLEIFVGVSEKRAAKVAASHFPFGPEELKFLVGQDHQRPLFLAFKNLPLFISTRSFVRKDNKRDTNLRHIHELEMRCGC